MSTETTSQVSVAVIGAGMAGLTCAKILSAAGLPVKVFDKGRRPGGRMSTRLADGQFYFDHGCQYFTASHPVFESEVTNWIDAKVAAEWPAEMVVLSHGRSVGKDLQRPLYVGAPRMASICDHLSQPLDVTTGIEVSEIRRSDGLWHLQFGSNDHAEAFETLVLAIPPRQAAQLIGSQSSLAQQANAVQMRPCWTVMVAFDRPVEFNAAAAIVEDSPLAWIARNTDKPNRHSAADCWVLQASADWSAQHIEQSKEAVCETLLAEFQTRIGCKTQLPTYRTAHRWRYALPQENNDDAQMNSACLADISQQLYLCGDWCLGNRVEAAFLSGHRTGQQIADGLGGRTSGLEQPT